MEQIAESFALNLRNHYEAQANALQIDINLITHANPYTNKPLTDNVKDIDKKVYGLANSNLPNMAAAEDNFVASAGKRYSEFVRHINNAMEEKESGLSRLHVGISTFATLSDYHRQSTQTQKQNWCSGMRFTNSSHAKNTSSSRTQSESAS
jgi:hypothetical protein